MVNIMPSDDNFEYIAECNRCLHCAKPGCVLHCPIANDIPQFLKLASEGNWLGAALLIGHPLGEVCGYVCPHEHCQGGCVLGKRGEPVDIAMVERELFARYPYPIERQGRLLQSRRVAIVGGGVSGVTFAVKMYEQGADVTLYERRELLSTLQLIPEFRLPHEALDRIRQQLKGKINIVCKNTNLDDVDKDGPWDVIYVATGAAICRSLNVTGEEFSTPYSQFLAKNEDMSRKKVVIVGGGNTAMDCARLAKRLGADVAVAYRREREDMPAFEKEISSAEEEGIAFIYNVAPIAIARSNGILSVDFVRTQSKKRGEITFGEAAPTVVCDEVVAAIGSKFDDAVFAKRQLNGDVRHPLANVYAGGDATGGKTVAQAVADALQTARQIIDGYKNS